MHGLVYSVGLDYKYFIKLITVLLDLADSNERIRVGPQGEEVNEWVDAKQAAFVSFHWSNVFERER